MRIYQNFREALGEIKRDLAEMGIMIHPQTYQDKFVGDNPDFETLELQNYIYTVISPLPSDLQPVQPWADKEFGERISRDLHMNPGEAWKERPEVWVEFLQDDGKFAYTYSERIWRYQQLDKIINQLKKDPDSRQAFLSIWDAQDIGKLGGISRIPCSLGYQFQIRKSHLNITYLQRSADFATHFENDVYLAHRLQEYVAQHIGLPVGTYTHWIASLHVFKKDVRGVF